MSKILAINSSYRINGITDQAIDLMAKTIHSFGSEIEVITLRNYPIEFCLNCRECTQQKGKSPGKCVLHDGMQELIEKIEQADGFILASPTNFGSVTALFQRFLERLVVYGYWPWGMNSPKFRKEGQPQKKAVLISSSAAPGVMNRLFFNTHSQLKTAAKTIGAKKVGILSIGLIAKEQKPNLPPKIVRKLNILAEKLI